MIEPDPIPGYQNRRITRPKFDPDLEFEALKDFPCSGVQFKTGDVFDKLLVDERRLRQMYDHRWLKMIIPEGYQPLTDASPPVSHGPAPAARRPPALPTAQPAAGKEPNFAAFGPIDLEAPLPEYVPPEQPASAPPPPPQAAQPPKPAPATPAPKKTGRVKLG